MAIGITKNCGNCAYFKRVSVGQQGGLCRARPPVPLMVGMAQNPMTKEPFPVINTYWPQIPDSEWCGDHNPALIGREIDLSQLSEAELVGEG